MFRVKKCKLFTKVVHKMCKLHQKVVRKMNGLYYKCYLQVVHVVKCYLKVVHVIRGTYMISNHKTQFLNQAGG